MEKLSTRTWIGRLKFLKFTQLGLDMRWQLCRRAILRILRILSILRIVCSLRFLLPTRRLFSTLFIAVAQGFRLRLLRILLRRYRLRSSGPRERFGIIVVFIVDYKGSFEDRRVRVRAGFAISNILARFLKFPPTASRRVNTVVSGYGG